MNEQEENDEINKRMEWYYRAYDDKTLIEKNANIVDEKLNRKTENDKTFKIELVLSALEDILKQVQVNVCEREVTCKCFDACKKNKEKEKNIECACDDDLHWDAISCRAELSSSCRFCIQLGFSKRLGISSKFKRNLRFFYFSKDVDEEIPIFDIARLLSRRGDEVNSFDLILNVSALRRSGQVSKLKVSKIQFPVEEINIRDYSIDIIFNYMHSEILP